MRPRALLLVRVATTVGLTFAVAGCVRAPMTVAASYASHPQNRVSSPVVCKMRVVAVTDERMDPTVLGVVAGRTVRAPGDAQAWIRSVIGGLQASGIKVEFADSDSDAPGTFNTRVLLRTAWVSSATTAKMANVVFNIEYRAGTATPHATDYRGHISSPNWNSTDDELQSVVNRAFDQALEQIATDFRSLCGHGP